MNKKGQYTEIYFLLFEVLMILVFAYSMFSFTNNAVGSDAFSRDYAAVDSALLIEFLQNAPGNFVFNYGYKLPIEYKSINGVYNVCLNDDSISECSRPSLGLNKNIGLFGAAKNENIVRFFKTCNKIAILDKTGPVSGKIEGYLDRC